MNRNAQILHIANRLRRTLRVMDAQVTPQNWLVWRENLITAAGDAVRLCELLDRRDR